MQLSVECAWRTAKSASSPACSYTPAPLDGDNNMAAALRYNTPGQALVKDESIVSRTK